MKEDICPYCKQPMTDKDRLGVGGRGVAHLVCEEKTRGDEAAKERAKQPSY